MPRIKKTISTVVGCLGALSAVATALPVHARSAPEITRAVYVERMVQTSDGTTARTIEPADRLGRGDRVILVMEWDADMPRTAFTLASPVPRHLAFRRGDGTAQVSTDGGRNWGRLGELRHGERLATPEDVTHLRWRISSAQAASGRVTYLATVR